MLTYGYFNSVSGDRKYNAAQMTEYFDGLVSNGVYESIDDALQVTALTGLQVSVGAGRAIIACRWLRNDSAYTLTLNAANGLYPRYTAVVVRLDNDNRLIEIITRDGTAASDPVEPAIDTSTELCLAMILVPAGATSITQANITDRRADSTVCGWVTGLIKQVDTSTLWAQWQAAYQEYYDRMTAGFEEWFSSLTDQLNVNTYVDKYSGTVYLNGQTGSVALTDVLENYTYDAEDVVNVYLNGLMAVEGLDYQRTGTAAAPRIAFTVYDAGTEVTIEVLKSKIGFEP
jgi:hypothetical protein